MCVVAVDFQLLINPFYLQYVISNQDNDFSYNLVSLLSYIKALTYAILKVIAKIKTLLSSI